MPKRKDADQMRDELETLREMREAGKLTPSQFNLRSARLLHQIKTSTTKRRRFAET